MLSKRSRGRPFTYSDEQWLEIAKLLPSRCDKQKARSHITMFSATHADQLHSSAVEDGKVRNEHFSKLQNSIRQLRADLGSDPYGEVLKLLYRQSRLREEDVASGPSSDPDSAKIFMDVLERIELASGRRAEAAKESAARAAGAKRHKWFYSMILDAWVRSGGQLRFSRNKDASGKMVPTGPLIRFFQAVSEPVLGDEAAGTERIAELISQKRKTPDQWGFDP